jgi:hypothetical protein
MGVRAWTRYRGVGRSARMVLRRSAVASASTARSK